MNWRRIGQVVLSMIAALSAVTSSAAELRKQIDGLFQRSNVTSLSAFNAARDYYDELKAAGAQDARIDYAFALVLIEQHRLEDAGKKFDEFLAIYPNELHARRARVWIQLSRREDQAALVGLVAIAKRLNRAGDQTPSELQKDSAVFVGRAIAFLEGPAAAVKVARLVADTKNEISALLPPGELAGDFERGRLEISEQYKLLREEVETAKSEATKKQTEAIEKQAGQVDAEQAALAEKQQAVQERLAEQNKETRKDLTDVQSKQDQLREALAAVTVRAAPLQAQITNCQRQIASLTIIQNNSDGTNTITYRDQGTRNRVLQLQNFLSQVEIQLAPLVAEATAINARMLALRNKGQTAVMQQQQENQRLSGTQEELQSKAKKLERIAKAKGVPKANGVTAKTRSLSTMLTSFSTYDPYPLEEEKARILDSIK